MLEASIVVIGDEILGGFVQDTNSHWLAAELRSYGVPVTRIHTVPDEHDAIAEALHAELARARPRLIITTGGIGPTPDDITFEAVARALGRELVVEPWIARRVEVALGWQADGGLEVDDEFRDQMMRMARVPEGGELINREGGWVPGIRLDLDGGLTDPGGATILILPGLPSELRAITRDVIRPLVEGRNPPVAIREVTHGFPETALNRAFVRLAERYPGVKVGSYPGVPMVVRLSGEPEQVEAAARELEDYIAALEAGDAARLRDAWTERFRAMEQRP